MILYACFRVSNNIIIVLILFYGRKISFTFAVIPTKYSIDFFFSCFLSYSLLWFILSILFLFSRCFCFDMDTRMDVVARKLYIKQFTFNSYYLLDMNIYEYYWLQLNIYLKGIVLQMS